MADLATLGMRFATEGGAETVKTLDQVDAGAKRVERSTDALSNAQRRNGSAVQQMIANIEKAVMEMRDLQVGMAEGAMAAIKEAQALERVKTAATGMAPAVAKAAAETRNLGAAAKATAVMMEDQSAHILAYRNHLAKIPAVNNEVVKTSKLVRNEMLNLTRQASDVGVTLAMGMNPLMVAIQQGPQIAESFALMKREGVGASQAFKQMFASVAPLMRVLGPIAVVAGAAAAAFGLFHREMNKSQTAKQLIDELKLTEEQLKKVKDETITFGDTMQATFNVLGRYLMDSGIGKAIAQLRKDISAWLNEFAANSVKEVAVVVGVFTGAFEGVKAVWENFPAVMGDIITTAMNGVIKGVEFAINKAISAINQFGVEAAATLLAGPLGPLMAMLLKSAGGSLNIKPISLPRLTNENAGAARDVGKAIAEGYNRGQAEALAGLAKFLKDVRDERADVFQKRIKELAGDAKGKSAKAKAAQAALDKAEEAAARIAQQIEQALADELRARLALLDDVRERAEIEKDIILAQTAAKQAAIEKQIAEINDPNNLSFGKGEQAKAIKAGLTAQLRYVQAISANTAVLEMEEVDRKKTQQLVRDALDLQQARYDNMIDVMEAEKALLQNAYLIAVADKKILEVKQRAAREAAQARILLARTPAQLLQAQGDLAALKKIQKIESQLADRATDLHSAMQAAVDGVRGFKDAFKSRNWAAAVNGFAETLRGIQVSFQQHGMLGGIATAGSAIGSLIGGSTGRVIGRSASYLGAGVGLGAFAASGAGAAALGSLGLSAGMIGTLATAAPVIGAVIAGLYGLSKLFSKESNKGAGYDLITGEITGKSRTEETEGAVKQAADAILAGQETLKALGLTLTDSIRGLVIGSRDQSQIYTKGGQTIYAAKGDPAAAVDAALGALIDGATFMNKAQEDFAKSLRAAGVGFDKFVQKMQEFAAAQDFATSISDELLKRVDPQKYDETVLKRGQDERDRAFKSMVDAGYFTAEQAEKLGRQLEALKAIEFDEVVGKYSNALKKATVTVEEARSQLQQAYDAEVSRLQTIINGVDQARQAVQTAYDKERSRLQGIVDAVDQARSDLENTFNELTGSAKEAADKFEALADSLKKFKDDLLTGPQSGLSPEAQYIATKARFDAVAARVQSGDASAVEELEGVGRAFRDASRDYFASSGNFFTDQQRIVDAVTAGEALAMTQVDVAQAQLDALNQQVEGMKVLNKSTMTLSEAFAKYQAAVVEGQAAQEQLKALDAQVAGILDVQEEVTNVADAIAKFQDASVKAEDAKAQLAALNQSVEGLLDINTSVLSVRDAILQLQDAMAAAELAKSVTEMGTPRPTVDPSLLTPASASGTGVAMDPATATGAAAAANDNAAAQVPMVPDYAAYVQAYEDLRAAYQVVQPQFGTEAAYGQYHWTNFGQAEGRTMPMMPEPAADPYAADYSQYQYGGYYGFATGGEFTVGGYGGPDSQNFGPMNLSPGEIVNVRRPGEAANDSEELRALRQDVRDLKDALVSVTARGAERVAQATERGFSGLDRTVRDRGKTQRLAGKGG